MRRSSTQFLNDIDGALISRRQLLQVLATAAVAAPAASFAQNTAAGR